MHIFFVVAHIIVSISSESEESDVQHNWFLVRSYVRRDKVQNFYHFIPKTTHELSWNSWLGFEGRKDFLEFQWSQRQKSTSPGYVRFRQIGSPLWNKIHYVTLRLSLPSNLAHLPWRQTGQLHSWKNRTACPWWLIFETGVNPFW